MRRLITVFMLLSATTAWASGYYRWVDEKGAVHYSEIPPAEGAASIQEVGSPSGSLSTPKEDNVSVQPKPVKQAPEKTDLKSKNCKIAQDNLEVMNRSKDIHVTGENGEKRILTKEEVELKKLETEKDIEIYCK